MAEPQGLLTQLVRAALNRSGGATQAEVAARHNDVHEGGSSPSSTLRRAEDDHVDRISLIDQSILDVLAEKVLLAWLRNRYQLLFPFALDFKRLTAS